MIHDSFLTAVRESNLLLFRRFELRPKSWWSQSLEGMATELCMPDVSASWYQFLERCSFHRSWRYPSGRQCSRYSSLAKPAALPNHFLWLRDQEVWACFSGAASGKTLSYIGGSRANYRARLKSAFAGEYRRFSSSDGGPSLWLVTGNRCLWSMLLRCNSPSTAGVDACVLYSLERFFGT